MIEKDYRYEFEGFGKYASACRIRICEVQREAFNFGSAISVGMTVVIASDVGGSGTSITNMAEQLATAIVAKEGIAPQELLWIEHYPHSGPEDETFDVVTFQMADVGVFAEPGWQSVLREDVERLIGKPGYFSEEAPPAPRKAGDPVDPEERHVRPDSDLLDRGK